LNSHSIGNPHVYSPEPRQAYAKLYNGHLIGLGMQREVQQDYALWNLLWLSDPSLDKLLTWPDDKIEAMPLSSPWLATCVATVGQKLGENPVSVLLRSLSAPTFVERVKNAEHAHFEVVKRGGAAWLRIAELRSRGAREMERVVGNVQFVDFRKEGKRPPAADINSAVILTFGRE
jgi:hypothetical protein